MSSPRTLFDKIWDAHVVTELGDEQSLLYIDCHLVNEVTSPQAFSGLRNSRRHVRRPANERHRCAGPRQQAAEQAAERAGADDGDRDALFGHANER